LVRFGDRIEQTTAVAGAVGAARLVATSTPQNRRLAEVLSPRLEIPTLLVSEELPKPDPKPAALANVPAFKALSRSARRRLARHLDPVSVKAGATLLREGRRNQTFWVILAGEVELTVRGMKARRFGAGDLLGATSMLDGVGATGTAVALTDIEALVAGPEDFRALEADPEIEAKLEAASRAVLRSEVLALRAAA
jgi:hypothetical protein